MKKFILSILLLAFFVGVYGQPSEYYFRFVESNKELLNSKITNIISIDRVVHDTVYAYANSDELSRFMKFGYKYTLLTPPSLSSSKAYTMATSIDQMAGWDRYPTYEVYRAMMKKYEQDYPTLCKLDSIGTTPNGHKLYVVKLSNNVTVNEAEVEVLYTSTIHGDEATGYILMLRLIDYLLVNYSTDTRIAAMLNSMAIYINPDANPDGTYRGGNSTISGATRYNAKNVDLNRNFPDPRAGNHPDDDTWQPENQMMMDFATSHHLTLSANFHGGAEVANYPWDTWTSSQRKHADNDWYAHLSRQYASNAQANGPTGYFNDENNGITEGGDWYVITGGRQDYMNWWQHCREVTMEISSTKLLSADQLPLFWNYNKEALLDYLESAMKGFSGTVKNLLGNPLRAKVFVLNHDVDSSHVYSSSSTGFYSRPIQIGTWQVKYTSPGYISQIHTIDISTWEASVTKNIVLIESQPATLTGTVINSLTSGAIQDVKVEILESSITPVYTNDKGEYTFSSIPQDIYRIKVSKPGYQSKIQLVEVVQASNTGDFNLKPLQYESFGSGLSDGFSCVNGDWVVDNNVYFEGGSSMRSAVIGNNATTSMQVSLNIVADGSISFARKVSSESGYDFLRFYIDDVEKGKWSGEQNWTVITYPVTIGAHTFKWSYSKDGSVASGSDCAWVDSLALPSYNQNVTFKVNLDGNPCPFVPVTFNNQVVETNASGEAVFQSGRGVDKPYSAAIASLTPITGKLDVMYVDVNKTLDFSGSPSYTVTFNAKSGGVAVQDANVNINGTDVLTTAQGVATFSVPRGVDYAYTVSLAGYRTVTGQINILDNKTINVNLVPSATSVYTVTFDVKYQSNAIANASVVFNGEEQQTSSAGTVTFSTVEQGNGYTYTVNKLGYKTISGQVDVAENKSISIDLSLVFTVTFNVSHLGVPIENANVNFIGSDQLTNASGIVSFSDVPNGVGYAYTASKAGYKTVTGQVDVVSGKSVEVELIPVFTVVFNVKHQGLPLANASVSFNNLSQVTGADGTTSFADILYGMGYGYTVDLSGYQSVTGQVDVAENKNLNIDMVSVNVLIPDDDNLLSIWPNPFGDEVCLRLNLEKPAYINLSVFSMYGQKIETIVNGNYQEGLLNLRYNGGMLGSGSYIFRLQVDKKTFSQIMLHIR